MLTGAHGGRVHTKLRMKGGNPLQEISWAFCAKLCNRFARMSAKFPNVGLCVNCGCVRSGGGVEGGGARQRYIHKGHTMHHDSHDNITAIQSRITANSAPIQPHTQLQHNTTHNTQLPTGTHTDAAMQQPCTSKQTC
jgi:hypothetical protein